jgi:hypothetical protein
VNNCHPRALGIQRGSKTLFDALNYQASLIRPEYAREYFAQGAFARAVFTHDCVASPGHYVKTNVLKRDRSGIPFADAAKYNGGNDSFGTQEFGINPVQFTDWTVAAV